MKYKMRPRAVTKKAKKENQVATKKYVKNVLSRTIETKIFDYQSYNNISSVPFLQDLSQVAQGTLVTNRIGDTVKPTHLDIRYVYTVADVTNLMRLIIFKWHPDDASDAPQANEILEDTTTSYACISPYKWQDRERFTVLYDHKFTFATPSVIQREFSKTIKLRGNLSFNGTGLTGSSHIYFLLVSDSAAALHPQCLFYSRLYYKDA